MERLEAFSHLQFVSYFQNLKTMFVITECNGWTAWSSNTVHVTAKQQGARQPGSSNKVKPQIMNRSKPTPFLPPAACASDPPPPSRPRALARTAGKRDLIPGAASLVDPDGHRPDGLAIEVVSKLVSATHAPNSSACVHYTCIRHVARRRRVQHVFVRACVMWRAADVSISTHALPFSAGTHSMHKYALPVVGVQ